MKKTILLSYVALIISFAAAFAARAESEGLPEESLPPVMSLELMGSTAPTESVQPAENTEPVESVQPNASHAPAAETDGPRPAPQIGSAPAPAPETLVFKLDEELITTDMEDYVLHVTAAEMPANFEPEALKAQAVAARSYALYCARGGRHEDADVCADYACCQAWISEEQMKNNWGESYEDKLARLREAVEATSGQYLVYDGEPVFAAYHSSSCAATEDCAAVWNPRPYLVSVSSPENADSVPNYVSSAEFSPLDFRDTVLHARPDADFTGEESAWIGGITLDGSGRVSQVVLGGEELSGTELRALFSLRSTAFTLEYTGGRFLFTVTGFGHGVGMSQYGANVMAASGESYASILAHYYPGTSLVS